MRHRAPHKRALRATQHQHPALRSRSGWSWLALLATVVVVACATSNPGPADDAGHTDSATEASLHDSGDSCSETEVESTQTGQASTKDREFSELHGRLEHVSGDPIPDKIIRGTHYWVSNELSQGLFHPFIAGTGGLFMGVGTDQCYLLAGWQRAESLVLIDFDRYVVALHRAYRAFFLASATPEDFVGWWRVEKTDEALALLTASIEDAALRTLTLEAFTRSAKMVRLRLSRLQKQYGAGELGSFVTDPEQFALIKQLYRSNRVALVRANLVGPTAVQGLGSVLQEFQVSPRVVYLSNAEQYFKYSAAFKQNIAALGLTPETRILRTLSHRRHGFADGEQYHYNVQTGDSLMGYLEAGKLTSSSRMLTEKQSTGTLGLSILGDISMEPLK